MRAYLVQRALGALIAILGVSVIVFSLLRLTGDPAGLLLDSSATREDYIRLQRALGLDEPLPMQYVRFLAAAAHGDFGNSFRYKQPALQIVLQRVPATAALAASAFALSLIIAIPLGILSAVRHRSALDQTVALATLVGQGMPSFWLGIILILLVAVNLSLLPVSGSGTLAHLVLPAITLAAQPVSKFTRLTRSEVLEVLRQDYVRTARAKGLSERVVQYRHALRNAALALVTVAGLDVGYLLGGSIIVETVFAWPGIGRLMIDAVTQRDFPVVQADVFLIACTVVAINFVVDVLYCVLDPRIRLEAAS